MKAALFHVLRADHSKLFTVDDYVQEFMKGTESVPLYKSIFFQKLPKERKELVQKAWDIYQERKVLDMREIEALQRSEEREAAKPYPSITEVLERITANPELIQHFIGLLELNSTVIPYRDNIRKAVWYYNNTRS